MDFTNGGHGGGGEAGPSEFLSPDSLSLLAEGISLVVSRWTALQMAVENQWGGRDSRSKADQLSASIFSWFAQPKPPLYIDDLEYLIDESMFDSFNTEVEDGSIEEVAEQLMIMHEECLKGKFDSIENLRKLSSSVNAVSQSRKVNKDGEVEESSDDEGDTEMMSVDDVSRQEEMDVGPTRTNNNKPVPDEEGWTVVPPRRNRGRN